MTEYAVFSKRMLTGTISDLPHGARLAWIAILFEAERLRGRVKLPVRDLAKIASITTPEAAEALKLFQEPDPYSSSKEHEGRRLLPVSGEEDWYVVVTWEAHAKEREAFFNRLRQQRFKTKQRGNGEQRSLTVSNDPVTNEPEPELEPKESKSKSLVALTRSEKEDWFERAWTLYPKKAGKKEAHRHYSATVKTQRDGLTLQLAMERYLATERVRKGFVQDGSTWFNNWQDWLKYEEPHGHREQTADEIAGFPTRRSPLRDCPPDCEHCGGAGCYL